MQTTGDFGHIGQINTGEGKTTIISVASALKVVQGFKVHVITSNEVLAREGVESTDRANFYKLLNISVSHNNPEEKSTGSLCVRTCYKADICFGSINNFQFDWLKDSFEKLGTMGKLDFSQIWLMLDEIDSLLIDQGSNLAKLSGPFPGLVLL